MVAASARAVDSPPVPRQRKAAPAKSEKVKKARAARQEASSRKGLLRVNPPQISDAESDGSVDPAACRLDKRYDSASRCSSRCLRELSRCRSKDKITDADFTDFMRLPHDSSAAVKGSRAVCRCRREDPRMQDLLKLAEQAGVRAHFVDIARIDKLCPQRRTRVS